MEKLAAGLRATGEVLFLLAAAPVVLPIVLVVLLSVNLWRRLQGHRSGPADRGVATRAASVVIPTWNGLHHLERNLLSVAIALEGNPDNELIVVDDGSTDGTVDWVRRNFPQVRVIELQENLGFGASSNVGFREARNDVVVLLNNDMRVGSDFLEPLLEGFCDPRVFAVTAQILFSDPSKRREETGLTHGEWLNGRLAVRHVVDDQVSGLFPTFYAGGGSTAYDRRKFLELGSFDPLLHPFYLEDTDVSYMAWKRGWAILYQPRSIVYHEHRGTIGSNFSSSYIQSVLQTNYLLFTWKNIHEARRLAAHLFWVYWGLWLRILAGPTLTRPTVRSFLAAVRRFGSVLGSRQQAIKLAVIDDTEAFRRPLGGYFRDRFGEVSADRDKLNVLFISPYPIEPPLHGGAVFMNQTVSRLAKLTNLHLLCLLDEPEDLATNQRLAETCASAEFVVRWKYHSKDLGALLPHAVRTFYSSDFLWTVHRCILQHNVDAVQLDYTQMASYAADFDQIATFLFEHDVYFQSISRSMKRVRDPKTWLEHFYEYLRALHFERRTLANFDAVQVCTAANRRYLESYTWRGAPIQEGLRAGIDTDSYPYIEHGREPDTLLFVGNFRHSPNRRALEYFAKEAFPLIRFRRPSARLIVVGAQEPPGFRKSFKGAGIEFVGRVPDIRGALAKYAVFVCPVLSGSGVRVKLLEAFASGIPVVSTKVGAEGLVEEGNHYVEIADTPEDFAARVVALLDDPDRAIGLARQARREVETNWDFQGITVRLEQHYRQVLTTKLHRNRRDSFVPFAFPRKAGGLKPANVQTQ